MVAQGASPGGRSPHPVPPCGTVGYVLSPAPRAHFINEPLRHDTGGRMPCIHGGLRENSFCSAVPCPVPPWSHMWDDRRNGFLRGGQWRRRRKKECLFFTNEAIMLLKTKGRQNERSQTKPISESRNSKFETGNSEQVTQDSLFNLAAFSGEEPQVQKARLALRGC